MCYVQLQIYEKDNNFFDRIKKKTKLRNKAAVVERMVQLIRKHKMEDEI